MTLEYTYHAVLESTPIHFQNPLEVNIGLRQKQSETSSHLRELIDRTIESRWLELSLL